MQSRVNPIINTFRANNIALNSNKNNSDKNQEISYQKQPKASKKVRRGVLLTTSLGVATATALCLKKHGFKLNSFKNVVEGLKNLKYEGEVVPVIAAGSIGGGLVGGAIFDEKKNFKAKLREAAVQMIANVLIPLACVTKGGNLFKKYVKKPIMERHDLLKNEIPIGKKGKTIAGLFDIAALVVSLGTAIVFGNKVGNLINEQIYNIRDDRNVKISDLSGHVDDTCLAISKSFDDTSP